MKESHVLEEKIKIREINGPKAKLNIAIAGEEKYKIIPKNNKGAKSEPVWEIAFAKLIDFPAFSFLTIFITIVSMGGLYKKDERPKRQCVHNVVF